MSTHYPLDPEDEDKMLTVEQALSQALPPVELPVERSVPLRARLMARVREASEAGQGFIRVPLSDAEWHRMLPGVQVHFLGKAQRAVIVELAPGASLPVHRHHEDEECVVLRGEATLGDLVVRQGDYHLARSRSRHGKVSSRTGALLFLRGTPIGHGGEVVRDLVTALLPGRGVEPLTIRGDEGQWVERGDGIRSKLLREDAESRSLLLQMAPGSCLPTGSPPLGDECLLVEGEASVDDWLMQPGDYQVAREGARHTSLSSAGGALWFVREAR